MCRGAPTREGLPTARPRAAKAPGLLGKRHGGQGGVRPQHCGQRDGTPLKPNGWGTSRSRESTSFLCPLGPQPCRRPQTRKERSLPSSLGTGRAHSPRGFTVSLPSGPVRCVSPVSRWGNSFRQNRQVTIPSYPGGGGEPGTQSCANWHVTHPHRLWYEGHAARWLLGTRDGQAQEHRGCPWHPPASPALAPCP